MPRCVTTQVPVLSRKVLNYREDRMWGKPIRGRLLTLANDSIADDDIKCLNNVFTWHRLGKIFND